MTTIVKTFTFDTDAEGFVYRGGILIGAYDGSDGSPASGCISFVGDPAGADSGQGYIPAVWESLGVWPGATVTAIECTGYKVNSDNAARLDIAINVWDDTFASIAPAIMGSTNLIVGPTGWISGNGLTGAQSFGVSPASAATVLFVIDVYSENSGATTIKFDTITIAITFTGGTNPAAVNLGGGWSVMNDLAIQRLRRGDEEIILLSGRRSQS